VAFALRTKPPPDRRRLFVVKVTKHELFIQNQLLDEQELNFLDSVWGSRGSPRIVCRVLPPQGAAVFQGGSRAPNSAKPFEFATMS
jgi:hypothetical protein